MKTLSIEQCITVTGATTINYDELLSYRQEFYCGFALNYLSDVVLVNKMKEPDFNLASGIAFAKDVLEQYEARGICTHDQILSHGI